MAVVSLDDPGFPDYHELFRLHMDGGVLLFDPSMHVELRLKEGLQTTAAILTGGLAAQSDAGWRLPLVVGSKGAVRFGDLALLFKIRQRRELPLKAVRKADPTPCGACAAPMPWAISGFGALCPCSACGALNEVQIDSGAPEDRRTQMTPVIRKRGADLPTFDAISVKKLGTDLPSFDSISAKKGTDLPTFDAISVGRGADLPTFDSITVGKQSDLPTFDSITVGKQADLPTFDSIEVLKEGTLRVAPEQQSAPTRRMPFSEELSGPQDLTPGKPSSGRGADLPTFDAMSAFQDQGLSATAAVTAMRDPSASPAEPLRLTVEPPGSLLTETAPMQRRVPAAAEPPVDLMKTDVVPPVHKTDRVDISAHVPPAPVQAVAEVMEEKDFFGEDFLVDLEQQRSFVSVPILKQPDLSAPRQIGEPVGMETRKVPTGTPPPRSKGVPPGATPPPHGTGAAPAARDQLHGRPSAFLRNDVPPPRPALTPADEGPDDPDSDDDFLMGRSDLPRSQANTNRWLLVIGTVAGLSGVALIVYKLALG